MKRTYKDPLLPQVPNRWREIRRARGRATRASKLSTGIIDGILVIIVTLVIFGWMPLWPDIRSVLP